MALKKTFCKTQPGFTGELVAVDAYWKVLTVSGNKETVSARVGGFAGQEQIHEMAVGFVPEKDDFNFIKQTYVFMKTLPEFSDAVDC